MPEIETSEPSLDLFLDTLVDTPLRDDRALLEFPWFGLSKRPQMKALTFERDEVKIVVSPGSRGVATIWDRDVLIYAASKINEAVERGEKISKTMRFVAHDFLKVTNRGTNKGSYELLKDALFRLRSTTIETTITSAGQRNHRGFGWLDSFEIVEDEKPDGSRRMRAVEITISDWMFRAITKERRVLSINADYFKLEGGLERRLYQLARKHVGRQRSWRCGLARLAEKVGTTQELRFFKRDLRAIIDADSLPDYRYAIEGVTDVEIDPAFKAQGIKFKPRPNDKLMVTVSPKGKRLAKPPALAEDLYEGEDETS